jgi:hypothetical protein
MTKTTTATAKTSASRRRASGPWLLALMFAGATLSAGACNRQHLSANYGMAYSAWFDAQRVRRDPDSEATKQALGSLDAQEASSISKNYRKASSGGQGDAVGQGQMVMIGQTTRGGGDSYTPPPSVPGGN